MIYLVFIVVSLVSIYLGYRIGVYTQTIWMTVIYEKVMQEIMTKYKIDKTELTNDIRIVANKFHSGEYSVSDIYRNSSR